MHKSKEVKKFLVIYKSCLEKFDSHQDENLLGQNVTKEDIEISKETEAKVVDEKKTEDKPSNLNEISSSVQRRIDQLTKRYREAERREKAALDYAKGIQDKYKKAETTLNTIDDNYLKEFDARVDAQREQVKSNLKSNRKIH